MTRDKHLASHHWGRNGAASVFWMGAFFVLLVGGAIAKRMPVWVLALYAGVSLMTFGIYAFDKKAARDGRQRIPESTLHILTLAGGWPGALLAQQLLRHKSRKQSYRIVFWATVMVNVVAVGWVLRKS